MLPRGALGDVCRARSLVTCMLGLTKWCINTNRGCSAACASTPSLSKQACHESYASTLHSQMHAAGCMGQAPACLARLLPHVTPPLRQPAPPPPPVLLPPPRLHWHPLLLRCSAARHLPAASAVPPPQLPAPWQWRCRQRACRARPHRSAPACLGEKAGEQGAGGGLKLAGKGTDVGQVVLKLLAAAACPQPKQAESRAQQLSDDASRAVHNRDQRCNQHAAHAVLTLLRQRAQRLGHVWVVAKCSPHLALQHACGAATPRVIREVCQCWE